ncbi:small acid-soluble spore protein Tlp [Aquibacillus sp. 3ASR75-11]|uniref:Small, acid-soluble spore protein Tlp n=1 Tax=Terrihalobacillus insolitus TaxID=2950438 RepID=A0A9X3WU09_9BACI|nr:small acid-soluble spore protein Tlp [Terrihalobacillus insolitus]MDC3415024.1 small acid-soluble spore protein Tlp [Terrihalobacillus insolitus]MDC3425922.1 small acid-soluble spore protein Tlp [Terrihalobacillus insolitus]
MNKYNNHPKPDNRKDNVEKLQNMVQDTIENIEASHETMQFSSEKEKQNVKEKNKRREDAIQGMREEIKDEYRHQQQE